MVVASSSVGIGKGAEGGREEGGANSPAIWERGLAVIFLSSSLWCITCVHVVSAAMIAPSMAGILFMFFFVFLVS